MGAELDIQGLDALAARVEALGKQGDKIAGSALRDAASVLADTIRRNVPVSTVEHKHIRDDIKISRPKRDEFGRLYVEVGPGKDTAWRAKFLEFGTSKMSARPFMEPSVQESKREVFRRLAEALRRGLGM